MNFDYSQKSGIEIKYDGDVVQFHESVLHGKNGSCFNSSFTLILLERPQQGLYVYIHIY